VQRLREAAARTQCMNNLKQIGVALHNYHDTYRKFPPGAATDQPPFGTGGGWGSSWKVHILPFVEQKSIWDRWKFNGDSGIYVNTNNLGAIANISIPTYRCPSSPFPDMQEIEIAGYPLVMFTSYTGVMGSAVVQNGPGTIAISDCCNPVSGTAAFNGILYAGSQVRMTDITDGTSSTLIVAEQSDDVRDSTGRAIRYNNSSSSGTGPITSQGRHGWAMGAHSNNAMSYHDRVHNCTAVKYPINQRGLVTTTVNGATGVNEDAGGNIPFSSAHTGGANVLFADGSVRFLNDTVPLSTLHGLCTRNQGEVFSIDF